MADTVMKCVTASGEKDELVLSRSQARQLVDDITWLGCAVITRGTYDECLRIARRLSYKTALRGLVRRAASDTSARLEVWGEKAQAAVFEVVRGELIVSSGGRTLIPSRLLYSPVGLKLTVKAVAASSVGSKKVQPSKTELTIKIPSLRIVERVRVLAQSAARPVTIVGFGGCNDEGSLVQPAATDGSFHCNKVITTAHRRGVFHTSSLGGRRCHAAAQQCVACQRYQSSRGRESSKPTPPTDERQKPLLGVEAAALALLAGDDGVSADKPPERTAVAVERAIRLLQLYVQFHFKPTASSSSEPADADVIYRSEPADADVIYRSEPADADTVAYLRAVLRVLAPEGAADGVPDSARITAMKEALQWSRFCSWQSRPGNKQHARRREQDKTTTRKAEGGHGASASSEPHPPSFDADDRLCAALESAMAGDDFRNTLERRPLLQLTLLAAQLAAPLLAALTEHVARALNWAREPGAAGTAGSSTARVLGNDAATAAIEVLRTLERHRAQIVRRNCVDKPQVNAQSILQFFVTSHVAINTAQVFLCSRRYSASSSTLPEPECRSAAMWAFRTCTTAVGLE